MNMTLNTLEQTVIVALEHSAAHQQQSSYILGAARDTVRSIITGMSRSARGELLNELAVRAKWCGHANQHAARRIIEREAHTARAWEDAYHEACRIHARAVGREHADELSD